MQKHASAKEGSITLRIIRLSFGKTIDEETFVGQLGLGTDFFEHKLEMSSSPIKEPDITMVNRLLSSGNGGSPRTETYYVPSDVVWKTGRCPLHNMQLDADGCWVCELETLH